MGGQHMGGFGTKSECSSHLKQNGFITSKPNDEGHWIGLQISFGAP